MLQLLFTLSLALMYNVCAPPGILSKGILNVKLLSAAVTGKKTGLALPAPGSVLKKYSAPAIT
jgi:hypothetical protein